MAREQEDIMYSVWLYVCCALIGILIYTHIHGRAGGMSSQLVQPNLTMKTMQLNAWVANNFMNIDFLPLIL